jgi:hypothetical protein
VNWFSECCKKRHLRRYGRLLYPQLKKMYSGGEFFTEPQIRRAADEARLNPSFISYGLAMFLPQGGFERLHPDLPTQDYDNRRTLVASVIGLDAPLHGIPVSWDFSDASDAGIGGDGGVPGDAGSSGDGG